MYSRSSFSLLNHQTSSSSSTSDDLKSKDNDRLKEDIISVDIINKWDNELSSFDSSDPDPEVGGPPPTDPGYYYRTMRRYMNKKGLKGNILYVKLAGSTGFNLSVGVASDWDFLGVFAAPISQVLSLKGPPESVNSADTEKPDFVAHEALRICKLIMKGNPGIIETLFSDHFYYESPAWKALVHHRMEFLSKVAVKQYLGYVHGQLKQMNNVHETKIVCKKMYHVYRLLYEVQRITNGDRPLVWHEGENKERIMKIRRQEIAREELIRGAQNLMTTIQDSKPWDKLPERPNEQILENWLLALRNGEYDQ